MKKSFLAILLMAALSFSFSTPERNPDVVASPTEKTFNSYGTVNIVGCTPTHYIFQLTHVSGPSVGRLKIIINGLDSGITVLAGGTFQVPVTTGVSTSFALTYKSGQFPIIYVAGVTSDFECP